MRLNLYLFLLLVVALLSCSKGKQDPSSKTSQSFATEEIDTATAEAFFADPLIYATDSIAPPRIMPMLVPPKEVKTGINSHPVESNKVLQKSESLVSITPGKNGIPGPYIRSAVPSRRAVRQSEPVKALPPRMKDVASHDIQYIDVDQGLISSYIRTIMMDEQGNLWFGSTYGVSRYNGNSFEKYTTDSGLTDDMVTSILQDQQGDIWFGTGKGVTLYDGQHFFHYTDIEGFGNFLVRDIFEDSHGDLWFGTTGGLIHMDRSGEEERFKRYTQDHGLSGNHILSIEEDDRGYLWFGSDQGLTRYDGTTFTRYTTETGLISNLINIIFKDGRGDIWFGTDRGVSRYDGNVFINYSNEDDLLESGVLAIVEDRRGDIWFGTNRGVFHYESKLGEGRLTQYTVEDGLSNNRIRCIVEDNEGNLWFGTGGGGANRFKNTGFTHYTTSEGLSDNGIVFIVEDQDGTIWYGTDKGLNRFNESSFTNYTMQQGLAHNDVRCGLSDRRGKMWFGTANGLSRFDGYAFTNYTVEQGLPNDDILSLLEDSEGWFWVGTRAGVCRFNPQDLNDKVYWWTTDNGLLANEVNNLQQDRQGNIWMASEKGLCRYQPLEEGGNFTHYTTANGLLDDYVSTILEDSKERLWFGTMGGLNLFDETAAGDQFIDYTVKDGLSDNVIWSIAEDRNKNIWVSTEKGITLMTPEGVSDDNDKPVHNYFTFNKRDGLKRLDFSANSVCLDQQNRIWWGSEGATMLDLSQFELTSTPPSHLHLTHIEVNQEFVDFRSLSEDRNKHSLSFSKPLKNAFDSAAPYYNYPVDLDLPHQLDHLTFHFSAVDWSRPHRLEYQYYLHGQESDWGASSSEARVDYRNLAYGYYTLKVRAKGDAGVWSAPLEYSFHIRPAPWFSLGAWIFYIVFFLGLVFWFFRFQKKRWQLKNELKKEQAKSKRVSRRESFRSRLYTNLTHEFRTPLNVILGMTEQIESDPERYLKEGVPLIQRNGEQLLRLINQLLDLAKLEDQSLQLHLKRGNIISYLHYHTDSFKNFAGRKGLNLNFETNVQKVMMDYDPEQVGHIMTNLISNAVKFTPFGGRVTVRVDRKNNELQIEVSDTGIGIAEEHISRIFQRFYQVDSSTTRKGEGTGIGLAHTYELIKLMEGDIEVESKLDQGTTFRVLLPVRITTLSPEITPGEEAVPDLDPDTSGWTAEFSVPGPELPSTGSYSGDAEDDGLPRVLIVEDNHDTMTYLVGCLADRYAIDLAHNGQIGVDKALEHIPDLIISDVMMPEKSGYELCEILKNDERTSHIPIILLTAKADLDSKIKGLAIGADAYLYKPFKKKELLVRLEAMVEKQRKLLAHFSRKFEKGLVTPTPEVDVTDVPVLEDEFIERIRGIVAENYHQDNFSLMDICEEINMSRSQLYRKMKALINTSPSEFIRKYRLEKAKILLETTDMNASQVAYATGYKDPAHFSKSFLEEFSIHPSNAGKKGK